MRRLSEKSLTNSALFYLRRYSASVMQLRKVLQRRVKRALKERGGDAAQAQAWLDLVVERMVRAGYLDDERLAVAKTASLRRAGKSTRAIRAKLRTKGLPAGLVERATQGGRAADEEAVWTVARKKKLGVFRPEAARRDLRQKDLATLARAGFSYDLAKRPVDAREEPDSSES
ncbi:MAG: regulatory protein RecX [Myxococcaceae bacterium]